MLLNKKISLNVSTRFYLHFALILEIKILLVLDLNRVEISEGKTIFFFTTLTIFIMFCYKANNLLICYHLGSLADHYFLCLLSIILTVALLTQSTGLWIISAAEAALTLTCIYSNTRCVMETWRSSQVTTAVNTPLLSTHHCTAINTICCSVNIIPAHTPPLSGRHRCNWFPAETVQTL